MRCERFTPKRYQLKKEVVPIVAKGHPWLFRDKISSAAQVFKEGQWLRLMTAENTVAGYGLFEREGLIAIRVFKRGASEPTRAWLKGVILNALSKRENLRKYTNGFRALHGENDGLPAVVFDVYDKLGVLQTYSPSVDVIGRYAAAVLRQELGLTTVLWKPPAKRKGGGDRKVRLLFGPNKSEVKIREGKLGIHIDAGSGQKSGAFLDLRNLRKWLTLQKLNGARVLNLFSYTGTLGLACETAGAGEIWNVDISKGALDAAKKFHEIDPKRYRSVAADVFTWLGSLDVAKKFDVIIIDPPQMASLTAQVPQALRSYRKLFAAALPHLKKGGLLICCCCTSRIPRATFEHEAMRTFGGKLKLIANLKQEEDHPVGFTEGDYLKVLVFK